MLTYTYACAHTWTLKSATHCPNGGRFDMNEANKNKARKNK